MEKLIMNEAVLNSLDTLMDEIESFAQRVEDGEYCVDMDEQVALFLRSVYMTSTCKERPASLYESMNDYADMHLTLSFYQEVSGSIPLVSTNYINKTHSILLGAFFF